MEVRTSELTDLALDWAVATLEGYGGLRNNPHLFNQALIMNRKDGQCVLFSTLNFSANWTIAGPIIEKEKMDIKWVTANRCRACLDWLDEGFFEDFGPTPLIAAMRCFVASRLGDEIDIPEELLK